MGKRSGSKKSTGCSEEGIHFVVDWWMLQQERGRRCRKLKCSSTGRLHLHHVTRRLRNAHVADWALVIVVEVFGSRELLEQKLYRFEAGHYVGARLLCLCTHRVIRLWDVCLAIAGRWWEPQHHLGLKRLRAKMLTACCDHLQSLPAGSKWRE